MGRIRVSTWPRLELLQMARLRLPPDTSDGRLLVGGIPLDRLCERVGSTPFFAYDRALITQRVAEVRAALPDRVALGYAVKANPMASPPWWTIRAAIVLVIVSMTVRSPAVSPDT